MWHVRAFTASEAMRCLDRLLDPSMNMDLMKED